MNVTFWRLLRKRKSMGNVYQRKGTLDGRRAIKRVIAVNVISVKLSALPLPVSVTHPISLITWGWGFSFFINSSSDNKSLLSDSGAFATKKPHTSSIVKFSSSFSFWSWISIAHNLQPLPFNILTATAVHSSLSLMPHAVALATWEKAPLPTTFIISTSSRLISHFCADGWRGI